MAKMLSALIWLYRMLISPILGPNCRYEPSCAVYAGEAIQRFGGGTRQPSGDQAGCPLPSPGAAAAGIRCPSGGCLSAKAKARGKIRAQDIRDRTMDNKNLVLAIVLSLAIILAFQWLAPAPKRPIPPPQNAQTAVKEQQLGAAPATGSLPVGPDGVPADKLTRDDVLKASPRLQIMTPRLRGSIALKGARLDDLTLVAYHETVDPSSPAIVLLSPSGAPHAYLAETGWITSQPDLQVPGADTDWTTDAKTLTTATPVTLTWDNGKGLVFTRTISVDDNYMFTVRDAVENKGRECRGAAALRACRPHRAAAGLVHLGVV